MAPNDHLLSNNIPRDIVFDILLKVRIKSLCRFKSASKDWLALINNVLKVRLPRKLIVSSTEEKNPWSFYTLDSQFSHEFVEIDGFSDRSLHIAGSCNGLILLRSLYKPYTKITYYLWNPLTGKHRLIPSLDVINEAPLIEGLSYDSARDEFKIVMAIDDSDVSFRFSFNHSYVFSTSNSLSSSSSWNRDGICRYSRCIDHQAVVLNGLPHWIVSWQSFSAVIVYFDSQSETFVELPRPDIEKSLFNCRLTVLGNNLCCVKYWGSAENIQIWVLKESSWSKLFVMSNWSDGYCVHLFMPLCIAFDREEVEIYNSGGEARALPFYNLKEKMFEWRRKVARYCYMRHMVYYVETLASP